MRMTLIPPRLSFEAHPPLSKCDPMSSTYTSPLVSSPLGSMLPHPLIPGIVFAIVIPSAIDPKSESGRTSAMAKGVRKMILSLKLL